MRVLFTVSMILFLGITSCGDYRISISKSLTPSGDAIKEPRNVSDFSKVKVSGGIGVVLTQNDTESLILEASENLLSCIETSVSGGTLTIKPENGVWFKGGNVTAYLSVKTLDALSTSGGARVRLTDTLRSEQLSINGSGGGSFEGSVICEEELGIRLSGGGRADMNVRSGSLKAGTSGGGKLNITGTSGNADIRMSGGGRAEMNIDCRALKAGVDGGGRLELNGALDDANIRTSGGGHVVMDINCRTLKTGTSGGGQLDLAGSADNYTMSASGGGRVRGFDFTVKHFSADMSGGGSVEITATETIGMKASGGGRVNYKGNASVQYVSLSGGGKLNKVN